MKKIRPFILSALSILMASCEKEIEIDYRSVDKLYIIEGHLTNETAEVIITQTRDMDNPVKGSGIEITSVEISAEDGTAEILVYGNGGYYRSPSGFTGVSGTEYTLSVVIDGKKYVSRSTMQEQTSIESVKFQWEEFMDNKRLICIVGVNDVAGEDNYYCYRMYRNNGIYRWNVLRDRGYDGKVMSVNIPCMTESMAEDNKEEDRDEILYEGDEITIEIWTIDVKTYDYLYSLGLSERTSSNPIDDFSGGCLGYFSAHSAVRHHAILQYSEVKH